MKEVLVLAGFCGLVYGAIAVVPAVQEIAAMHAQNAASQKAAERSAKQNLELHGEAFNSHVKQGN